MAVFRSRWRPTLNEVYVGFPLTVLILKLVKFKFWYYGDHSSETDANNIPILFVAAMEYEWVCQIQTQVGINVLHDFFSGFIFQKTYYTE